MKTGRRLALRRETLTELSTHDLTGLGAGALPTLQAGCSVDDVNDRVEALLLKLTLQARCSWSCI
jgi:hypothetical protein